MQERILIGIFDPTLVRSPFLFRYRNDKSGNERVKVPERKHSLKSDDKGSSSSALEDFKTKLGTMSGPEDLVTPLRFRMQKILVVE